MMSTPWRCASAPPTGSLTEEAPRRRPLFRQLALAMVAVARESSGASSLDLSILFCLLLAARRLGDSSTGWLRVNRFVVV